MGNMGVLDVLETVVLYGLGVCGMFSVAWMVAVRFQRGSSRRVCERLVDGGLVAAAVCVMVAIVSGPPKPPVIQFKRPVKFPVEERVLPEWVDDREYSREEVDEAIHFLNLPVWSRGYVRCDDPRSEVTCGQVVRAAETIRAYEAAAKQNQDRLFVIQHPMKGLGNHLMTDVCGFVLALMSNRTVFVSSNHATNSRVRRDHAYLYPPSVVVNESRLTEAHRKQLGHYNAIPTDSSWSCFDVGHYVQSKDAVIGINDLLYAPMVYVNPHTAAFCREKFGLHATYFLSNYFSRLHPNAIQEARRILDRIPRDEHVLGMHVRYHRAGQYYSHGLNSTLPTVFEEIRRRGGGGRIALATDNMELLNAMKARFGRRLVTSNAIRGPDKDHFSAMIDMALVEGCDDIVVTVRSTYSYMIASRFGRAGWVIEKESAHAFPTANSQSMGISMLYHHKDHCDWRTNDRVEYCGEEHRGDLEYFFRYLVL